jgi:hypothetical protein
MRTAVVSVSCPSYVRHTNEFDAVHRLLDFVKSVPLVMGDRKQTALYFE